MSTDQATATAESVRTHIGTEPLRLSGQQTVTNELIASIATKQCGWSKRQLQLLGVGWPPPSGWRQRLVTEGRSLSAEEVKALYAARKTKRTAEADPAEIPVLPCPWCSRPVQRIEQGGHLKEFCNKRHNTAFNNALTKASIEYARLLRTPGALKTWTEPRFNPSPSGAEGLQAPVTPNGEPERQDSLSAPASPDVT